MSADTHWMRTPPARRIYDHRIRQTICETGDRDVFPDLNIPRSTVRSWIHRGVPDVVSSDLVGCDRSDLLVEIQDLRRRMSLLGAVIGLLTAMLRVSKVRFDFERLPHGEDKRILLRAIERSVKAMPLLVALRITRLSPSRYHSWCRTEVGCDLDDQPSCPRTVPTRLTPDEVGVMQEMVESSDHRHMSLRALALHAQ